MAQLSLKLLGSPRIEIDAVSIQIVRRKSLALLAYLAVTGDAQRRDTLATLFWPHSPQNKARGALRRELSALNHDLGPGWLTADRETAAIGDHANLFLDVEQFQSLLAGAESNQSVDAELELLTKAADLYRSDFLSGFTLPDCVEFDDWQFYQTESYRQSLASALERLCHLLSQQGDVNAAIPFQRRRLALDPLHEPGHRKLMRLYARVGQRAAALRQYEACRRILEHEIGVPPESTTTELFDAIRLNNFPPAREAENEILPVHDGTRHAEAEVSETDADTFEDQNRVVTVLAIGMSQPSESIWDLPPDEAAMLIRRLIDLVVEVTATYDGAVDHLLTDGAVALFGATQAHEDDPERATLAALRIRQAMADLPLSISAGITTGMVHLSGVGLGDRTELTALGAPVSLATRLQGLAGEGQILISGSTYRQTRGAMRTAPLELTLRGLKKTITVHQVIRNRRYPHKTRGIEGLRADLVGRDEELKLLHSSLDSITGRQPNAGGQAISLIGEAGVGKSRLVAELKRRWDRYEPTGPLIRAGWQVAV
jgi:DNA-binding SARP family transcriptional activator